MNFAFRVLGFWNVQVLHLCRRQDSSIGFGAPVRANMRTGGLTDTLVTSSLLESVRIKIQMAKFAGSLWFMNVYFFSSYTWDPFPLLFDYWHHVSYGQVDSGDLVAYGLIPEFIGRFPILVSLSALNEDQLVQVCSTFW